MSIANRTGGNQSPRATRTQPWVAVVGLAVLLGLVLYVVRVGRPPWTARPAAPAATPTAVAAPAPLPTPLAHPATEEAEMLTQSALRAFMQSQWAEGREALQRALVSAPDYVPAKMAFGNYYMHQREFDKAINTATEVLALEPDNLDADFLRMAAAYGKGDRPDVLDDLEDLLAKRPREPRYRYFQASVLSRQAKTQEAVEALYKVADEQVNDANYFRLRARLLCDEERWADALKDWDQVLRLEPTHEEAAGLKGVCLVHLGRVDEAVAWMQRGLKVETDDPENLRKLAAQAREHNDEETARKYEALADQLEKFIQARDQLLAQSAADPRNPEIYFQLAHLYNENNFYDAAVTVYLRALALNARHAGSLLELGKLYQRLFDSRLAFRFLERYLKEEPGDLEVRTNLGLEYEKFRRFVDGVRVMGGFPADARPDIEYMRTLRRLRREAGVD